MKNTFVEIPTLESSEGAVQKCSVKKMFLKISQNSQENTCGRVSFLIKLQAEATTSKSSDMLQSWCLSEVWSIPSILVR